MSRGDRIPRFDGAAHGRDRRGVFLAITLGVGARQRRLAQHVEGVAIVALFLAGGARQRAFDVAPHDELVAENAHRLLERGARHGLTQLAHQPRIPGTRLADVIAIERDHAAGEHESPGRGVHQQRVAVAQMLVPGAARNLVGDQPIGGFAIRNAQQRFGEAHEDHALARSQAVLAQEGIQRASTATRGAHCLHQPQGPGPACAGRGFAAVAPDPRGRVQAVVLR